MFTLLLQAGFKDSAKAGLYFLGKAFYTLRHNSMLISVLNLAITSKLEWYRGAYVGYK